MGSRDAARTRERLLRAAFQEMHRSGFRSADLNAILAAAGVTKGALYYHFDNKEALGYAVVDEIIASNLHQKWVQPLRNAKNPIDVLVSIIPVSYTHLDVYKRQLVHASRTCSANNPRVLGPS